MSRYDDEYDDHEDEHDDELEDEDGVSRSTSNPFSRPSSVRGAGLPQRPPNRPDGSVPSPIRSGGAGGSGSSNPFNRPGNSSGGTSSSSSPGVQPYQRAPLSRPGSDDKKNDETDRTAAVNRVLGSFGQKMGSNDVYGGDTHDTTRDDSRSSSSPNTFGTSRIGGGNDRSSDNRSDSRSDSRNDSHSHSSRDDSRSSSSSNTFGGSRLGGGSSGGNDRSDSRSDSRNDSRNDSRSSDRDDKSGGIGGLTRGLGGVTSRFGGGDDKKDDRSGGRSSGGGLTSRFGGGGDKKDDKSGSKSGGALGGLTSRFGGGDKKDNKSDGKSGSGLGGLTSRFGGSGGNDRSSASRSDKPSGAGGALGGLTSRFGGGDKKDNKSSSSNRPGAVGGALGGLTSRFGGGSKSNDSDSRSSSSSSSGLGSRMGDLSGSKSPSSTPSSSNPSSFGGTLSRGGKPDTSSGSSSRSPFGGGRRDANARSTSTKAPGPSLSERLSGLNPFGRKEETRSTRSRPNRTPKVDQGGLSLDNKLDIIGVSLVLGSLVLLLSSLSPTKGALTESINGLLSYTFGWGAVFVLGILFAIGVWLILRHFGDEAPVISRTRLIGLGLLFISALVLAQFIDAMQYQVGAGQDYLGTLKNVFLPIAYNLGRGGGWVGGEIYFLLLSNFGEIGGFLVVFIPILVGLMLALNVSASDLAMIVISNGRNLGDAMAQRRQRAAAERAAQQQALVSATQSISVSKPQEALPAAESPALPAPASTAGAAASATQINEPPRRIPITSAGRTSSVPFRPPEMAELEAQGAQPNAPAANLSSQPAATEKSSGGGLFSGIGARVLGALPIGGSSESDAGIDMPTPAAAEKANQKASQSAEKSSGGLRGRFFGGKSESAKPDAQPQTPAQAPAPTPSRQPSLQPSLQSQTAQTVQPAAQVGGLSNAQQAAAQQTAVQQPAAQQPIIPATPQEQRGTPRLGDLLRRQTTPAEASGQPQSTPTRAPVNGGNRTGSVNNGSTNGSTGVQPFNRPPLSRPPQPTSPAAPTAPANGDGQRTPERGLFSRSTESSNNDPQRTDPQRGDQQRPAASIQPNQANPPQNTSGTPEAIPDLQSRMQTLRQPQSPATQQPAAQQPATQPPQRMNPDVPLSTPRQTASTAFGKPSDPPFATTPRPPSSLTNAPAPPPPPRRAPRNWKMPDPAGVLSSGIDQEPDHELLLRRAHIIEETLSSFGAPGRVVDVRTGPVVTQFGVEPDYVPGRGGKKNRVKVSAIAALDKDLQLALGAKSIRIEAPVPGKGYVGIEVPNEKAEMVHLRDVLEAQEFKKIKSPLAIALGQGVDGTPVAADLGSMPHLLIAGTTGSGKSVCVNAIIASMLLNNPPDRLKFIMVDPKRVELTQYNGIPHLVAPVVVELERIVSVLKWVTREMDERYRKFSNAAARNIEDYNKHLPENAEQMPYIVVIIDELADLMMLAPDDTERVITRIAALARATGIHLVIATQRPSVDVVTGLIKANFPARIAFAVAGNTDSRVILDQPGAERLLGRGDMLYMSGDAPAPVRLQGVFVSDTEIGNITRYWRGQMTEADLIAASRPIGGSISSDETRGADAVRFRDSGTGGTSSASRTQSAFWDRDEDEDDDYDDGDDSYDDSDDEMYEQAVELVRRLNKASVSLLQRRLRIGYTRAARLIDTMEERGIVGPATEGSKPREVLPVR